MAALRKWESLPYCSKSNNYLTVKLFDLIIDGKDLVAVEGLLQEDVDIDASNSCGNTPLLLACMLESRKFAELLIKSGANVNRCNDIMCTALHYASGNGWTKIVQNLVKKVPDLNARDHRGATAMHIASRSGFLKIVKCLVENGADIDRKDLEDFTPLLCAAECSWLNIVELFLNSRANIDGSEGLLLYYASKNGWTQLVQFLVNTVPDLDKIDTFGETPLHAASSRGHLEIVKCLVEKGANINATDRDGTTPLLNAAVENHKDIVDFLMYSGANVNHSDMNKRTLLHHVSFRGWIERVQSLVNGGCDLDARDKWGTTPLSMACKHQQSVVQSLLQAGARWDIADYKGFSPLNYLTMKVQLYNFTLIKLLIENGAYLKPVDYDALVNISELKVLQDVKLCCQSIVNKFNNHNLPELYKLPVSGSLPRIEKMKIATGSEVAQAIERAVGFEIDTKGHCNVLDVRPMALSVLSVRSVLQYYKKKESELNNRLKRPAAFDSEHVYQLRSKSMHLSL